MATHAHIKARHTLHGFLVGSFQVGMTHFFKFITRTRISSNAFYSFEIDKTSRYLFVANHQSMLDPFAVFWALPLKQTLNAAPTRFLTAKTVYRTPMMPLLRAMGCYPTRGSRTEIIDESIRHMRAGYNIFFFPEGKRTTQADSQPRPGVSDMIKQSSDEFDDIKMILVHIDWKRLGFLRRHVDIKLVEAPKSLYKKPATDIMAALYEL